MATKTLRVSLNILMICDEVLRCFWVAAVDDGCRLSTSMAFGYDVGCEYLVECQVDSLIDSWSISDSSGVVELARHLSYRRGRRLHK